MRQKRAKRIMEALKEMGSRQILVVDPMSIYYLTGAYVEPFERFYVFYLREDGKHVYFLNKLLTVLEDMGVEKVWYLDTDPATEIVVGCLGKESLLGVDKDLKTRLLLPLMKMEVAVGFVNLSVAADRTRGVRNEEEQDKVCTAFDINDKATAVFKTLIYESATECQATDQMPRIHMDLGADGSSFEPLVAPGVNAADSHHKSDGTAIKSGNSVLSDVDCIKDRYCPNMTHTFYFRKASDEYRRIYEIVCSADEAAISKIRLGVPLCELDRAARGLIAEQGYGPFFTHRLGHLTGLREHEFGDVSFVNTQKAGSGVIFPIEPETHLSGDISARVEDLVLVIEDGYKASNHYSKESEIIDSSITG